MKRLNDLHYFLHTENYRIAFSTINNWRKSPYNYPLKNWFFSYLTQYPDCYTEVRQLYILGFGFGIKINRKQIN